ncbi:hypothetical protein J6590_082453 [Homalodisca vitripennis]|nr:hypothetical protein J6590_082453 [Homalodisca vitripennis]
MESLKKYEELPSSESGSFVVVMVFKRLQLLTLPSLYILETTSYCMLKCTLTNGRDVHSYETRGRENYRTRRHRTSKLVESVPVRPHGCHCRHYQPTIGGITENVTTLFSQRQLI